MTYTQVYEFYKDKRDVECEITQELIESGFYQKRGTGYMAIAEKCELNLPPSQWWHLMNYCLKYYEKHQESQTFRTIFCGELIFWMGEASGAVSKDKLIDLKNEIINNQDWSRNQKNSRIKNVCWNKIIDVVEQN